MYTAILETQNALQLNNTRSMKITQRKKNQWQYLSNECDLFVQSTSNKLPVHPKHNAQVFPPHLCILPYIQCAVIPAAPAAAFRLGISMMEFVISWRLVLQNVEFVTAWRLVWRNVEFVTAWRLVWWNVEFVTAWRLVLRNVEFDTSWRLVLRNIEFVTA